MSPIAYLLLPVGLSVVGSAVVYLWQRRGTTRFESDIDVFRQAMDILAVRPPVQADLPVTIAHVRRGGATQRAETP